MGGPSALYRGRGGSDPISHAFSARASMAGAGSPDAAGHDRHHAAAAPVPCHGGRECQAAPICAAPPGCFPLYLVAINIFVVPIAIAGLLFLSRARPTATLSCWRCRSPPAARPFALIAFLGGLSAATAMVIVEAVALSIMVCNNLVDADHAAPAHGARRRSIDDMGRRADRDRRSPSWSILLLAYSYYRMIGSSAALAQIGLISFAAVAQFAPAFFGGLVWKRGTARGAMAGHHRRFRALGLYAASCRPSPMPAGSIRSFIERGSLRHRPFCARACCSISPSIR